MRKIRSIFEVVNGDLCTGCGTCIAICPNSSIKMEIDKVRGIYVPKIDPDMCNGCGLCTEVCPGSEVDFQKLNIKFFGESSINPMIGNYINIYIGNSTDDNIRYNSSSGGLVTQILCFALEKGIINGALVTKMNKESPLQPQPFIARTKEEIIEASTSKYCPVPANMALKEILSSDVEKVAVVGLPCHIMGIRKAEMKNNLLKNKIVLHMGIFCSSTKNFLATEFQLKRMKIDKEDVSTIKYRGNGWPGYMEVKLKSGTKKSVLHPAYYDNIFCSFTPWRCTVCIDELSEFADLSFGDSWIQSLKGKDNKGTSIVISRSKIGEEILEEMVQSQLLILKNKEIETVIESQKGFKRKKYFKARSKISKVLFNKNSPKYNFRFESKNSAFDYIITTLIYLKYYFIFDPKKWPLLEVYCNILSKMEKLIK